MWQGWMKCSPTPPPALPVYPAGALLPTPAHPERLHTTGGRADHARHDTHARTIGQGAGFWTACATCPKLSRYGRLSGTPKQA